jgi:hypothetical protein
VTRLAKWFLRRRGYVVLSAGEFKVTKKICEDSERKLSRLTSGRRKPYGHPPPAEDARRAISQLMWVLRRALPREATNAAE